MPVNLIVSGGWLRRDDRSDDLLNRNGLLKMQTLTNYLLIDNIHFNVTKDEKPTGVSNKYCLRVAERAS